MCCCGNAHSSLNKAGGHSAGGCAPTNLIPPSATAARGRSICVEIARPGSARHFSPIRIGCRADGRSPRPSSDWSLPATPELPPDTRWHPVNDMPPMAFDHGTMVARPKPGSWPNCRTPTSDSRLRQRISHSHRFRDIYGAALRLPGRRDQSPARAGAPGSHHPHRDNHHPGRSGGQRRCTGSPTRACASPTSSPRFGHPDSRTRFLRGPKVEIFRMNVGSAAGYSTRTWSGSHLTRSSRRANVPSTPPTTRSTTRHGGLRIRPARHDPAGTRRRTRLPRPHSAARRRHPTALSDHRQARQAPDHHHHRPGSPIISPATSARSSPYQCAIDAVSAPVSPHTPSATGPSPSAACPFRIPHDRRRPRGGLDGVRSGP